MNRIALVLLAMLAGCATQKEAGWVRADGKVIVDQQFLMDRTICRGEMQKAALTAHPPDGVGQAYRRGKAEGEVFLGCMAQRGYQAIAAN